MTLASSAVAVDDLALVKGAIAELGEPAKWPAPVLLPGLALCLLNSIYSTGNRSEAVVRVLDRYRAYRRDAGADPDQDGLSELREVIRHEGGPDGFTEVLANRWRAWSRMSAPLKIAVVDDAATLLMAEGINTPADLVQALAEPQKHERLKSAWLGLRGQRSGLTWRYFLMNAGAPGIKADRMITRWVSAAVGRDLTPREAERLLSAAASEPRLDERRLDHAVWSAQRSRPVG